MLRTFLVFSMICMSVLFCLTVVFRPKDDIHIAPTTLIDRAKNINQTILETKSIHPIIADLNVKNEGIKSFSCDDVDIRIWQGGHRFKLSGDFKYEKPKGFRMEVSSVFGKELDLGSNDELFWYWSRRDAKPGLYWAVYEDYDKTRLKTPFNPMFMRSSLGLETLSVDDANVVESVKDVMLTYPREDSMGNQIYFSVFVNKIRKQIDGFLITDIHGKALVTCEIQEHNGDLPAKLLYTWHEEKRIMSLAFKSPVANRSIQRSSFAMPTFVPKINMADE